MAHLEEVLGSVMISSFSLDWLDYDSSHWTSDLGLVVDVVLNAGQAPLVLGPVLAGVLFQGVFVPRKLSFGPFDLWNVDAVQGSGMRVKN